MLRNIATLLVVGMLLVPAAPRPAAAMDFVVIQPGQPGTAQEAQPVMDALAAYVQQRLAARDVIEGRYFNELEPALEALAEAPPAWGIVSLGVFAQFADRFAMTPLAATRPGGSDQDRWRLIASKEGPDGWQELRGEVSGTMLFEPAAAGCLLFGARAEELPFTLHGTFNPLRALRAVTRGKMAGVVLDRLQFEAMQALPLAEKTKVVHASAELPTSPLVWFGPPDDKAENLSAVLRGMGDDPEAAALLRLLQTDGFGPADPRVFQFRLDNHEGCPR